MSAQNKYFKMKKLLLFTAILLFHLTGIAQTGLKTGEKAPLIHAKDNAGKTIDFKSILKTHKTIVLFFYRGQWCPYCNKHIQQLQDSLQLLTAKGAYVIGVTPETDQNISKTIEKTHASFSMIPDKDDQIMKAYGVNFTLDQAIFDKYKSHGVDLESNNGNNRHTLPVPATYIIDKSGKITFVHFDTDYRKRAAVSDILKEL